MQWVPVDNNCGTGAGGFKPGNDCASKHKSFTSKLSLMQTLSRKLPGLKVDSTYRGDKLPANMFGIALIGFRIGDPDRTSENLGLAEKVLEENGFRKVLEVHEPIHRSTILLSDHRVSHRVYMHPDGHSVRFRHSQNYLQSGTKREHINPIGTVLQAIGNYIDPRHKSSAIISQEALTASTSLKKYQEEDDYGSGDESYTLRKKIGTDEYATIRDIHDRLHREYKRHAAATKLKAEKQDYLNAANLHGMAADYYRDLVG